MTSLNTKSSNKFDTAKINYHFYYFLGDPTAGGGNVAIFLKRRGTRGGSSALENLKAKSIAVKLVSKLI